MPNLYIISGCNGSGKTTASYTLLPELLDCREYVNSDEFAKSLSPFNPAAAAIKASRYMLMKINYLMDRMTTFSIETTLATRTLMKTITRAQEKGYSVTILYFWLSSPQMAIDRVHARVAAGGHFISEEVIKRRYYLGLYYLIHNYIPQCDSWIIVDNSNPPFRVIAQGEKNGNVTVKDKKTYDIIMTITEWAEKLSNENGGRKDGDEPGIGST